MAMFSGGNAYKLDLVQDCRLQSQVLQKRLLCTQTLLEGQIFSRCGCGVLCCLVPLCACDQ